MTERVSDREYWIVTWLGDSFCLTGRDLEELEDELARRGYILSDLMAVVTV